MTEVLTTNRTVVILDRQALALLHRAGIKPPPEGVQFTAHDLDNHPPFAAFDYQDKMIMKTALANAGLIKDVGRRV